MVGDGQAGRRGQGPWVGVSNFDVDLLERCEAIRHVDSVQPPLSMIQRAALGDVIPWAAAHGTGVIVYSPMASGLLSGSFDRGRLEQPGLRRHAPAAAEFTEPGLSANLALVERLRAIAGELGCSVAELAIAWTLAQEGVTGAIVGARRPDQLDAWIGAGGLGTLRTSCSRRSARRSPRPGPAAAGPPAQPRPSAT